MWFSSWADIARVALSTVVAYAFMLTLVRLAGKRSIAKKNASDFIIVVAVGSTVATMTLAKDIRIVDGLTALAVLMGLQFAVITVSTRSVLARQAIEGSPKLLVFEGRLLPERMRREEVNNSEVLQAIRNKGLSSLEQVYAVVLEIDGSFSVVEKRSERPTALVDVMGIPEQALQEIRRKAS